MPGASSSKGTFVLPQREGREGKKGSLPGAAWVWGGGGGPPTSAPPKPPPRCPRHIISDSSLPTPSHALPVAAAGAISGCQWLPRILPRPHPPLAAPPLNGGTLSPSPPPQHVAAPLFPSPSPLWRRLHRARGGELLPPPLFAATPSPPLRTPLLHLRPQTTPRGLAAAGTRARHFRCLDRRRNVMPLQRQPPHPPQRQP